jgi:hypothetical protein
MEIEVSRRDSLRGENGPRREVLRGETLSMERTFQGEMIFKEIMGLWRDSSRRDSLPGELVHLI